MYYNRFRYYSPEEGIYISQDPIRLEGDNPTLYSYVEDTLSSLDVYGLSSVNGSGVNIEGAAWAQKTFSPEFSPKGRFAGQNVNGMASRLKSGSLRPSALNIDVVVRGNQTLILNTRSSVALTLAGVPRSKWKVTDRTGNPRYERGLNNQLRKSKLSETGTYSTKQRPDGPTITHTPKY